MTLLSCPGLWGGTCGKCRLPPGSRHDCGWEGTLVEGMVPGRGSDGSRQLHSSQATGAARASILQRERDQGGSVNAYWPVL